MLKILQTRPKWYVNRELPDIQAGFRKGRGTRDQIANICWIIEKARESQKNIFFIDFTQAFDCVDYNKLWKILKEMGVPDHFICWLRNLFAGQEATVSTGHETMNWFKTGKGICQGCLLSFCLFNFYAKTLLTKVYLVRAMVFSVVTYGWELDYKESWMPKNWCFWTVVLEKTWESLGLQDQTSQS